MNTQKNQAPRFTELTEDEARSNRCNSIRDGKTR
jgi:hypothetical protein